MGSELADAYIWLQARSNLQLQQTHARSAAAALSIKLCECLQAWQRTQSKASCVCNQNVGQCHVSVCVELELWHAAGAAAGRPLTASSPRSLSHRRAGMARATARAPPPPRSTRWRGRDEPPDELDRPRQPEPVGAPDEPAVGGRGQRRLQAPQLHRLLASLSCPWSRRTSLGIVASSRTWSARGRPRRRTGSPAGDDPASSGAVARPRAAGGARDPRRARAET